MTDDDAGGERSEVRDEQARTDADAAGALWQTLLDINHTRGVDLAAALATCVAKVPDRLPSPGGREAFVSLCDAGCHPWILAALISLIRHRPKIEVAWALIVGPADRRNETMRALDSAATAIEMTFNEHVLKADVQSFRDLGRISPAHLAAELRLYSRSLNLAALLAADLKVRSLDQVSALLLVGYVSATTTRPHHDSVSSLIGEARDNSDYSEEAHRQWFYRNRSVLNDSSALLGMVRFLVTMSEVLPRT